MKRITMCLAVVGLLVWAAPAMAWTYEDCVEVGFNHPDCDKYEKPPVVAPPVVTPPVVPPVTIPTPPVPPVVVPPVVPPVTPEAPKVEKPKKPKFDHPDAPRKKQTGERGKTEQRGSSYVPQGQTRTVSASSENGTLPYTGLPAGIMALAGAGLAAAGYRLRRR